MILRVAVVRVTKISTSEPVLITSPGPARRFANNVYLEVSHMYMYIHMHTAPGALRRHTQVRHSGVLLGVSA